MPTQTMDALGHNATPYAKIDRSTRVIQQVVSRMSTHQIRTLARSLEELGPERQVFIRRVLQDARTNRRRSQRHIELLEHLFDVWCTHDLATRIVLVAHIGALAGNDRLMESILASYGSEPPPTATSNPATWRKVRVTGPA